eukprot:88459-Prorocentrum_minimum.AAC.1
MLIIISGGAFLLRLVLLLGLLLPPGLDKAVAKQQRVARRGQRQRVRQPEVLVQPVRVPGLALPVPVQNVAIANVVVLQVIVPPARKPSRG